jgi:hypothetical protein
MATRAIIRDDDPERERQQPDCEAAPSPAVPRLIRPVKQRSLEEELEEVRAAIREDWDAMEPSLRYLADR